MKELHSKITEHLEATDMEEYNNYMLEYSIFIHKSAHERSDMGDRGTLRDAYIAQIARQYVDVVPEVAEAVNGMDVANVKRRTKEMDLCTDCGGYLLATLGHDVCESCGQTAARGDESISAVPFGVVVETTKYPYRRQHHFREWLCQIQGRESTHITDEDMARIKSQIQKERINVATMDQKRLRSILKTLRLQKLYEHVPHILHSLEGSLPPQLTHDLETEFMQMFSTIQEPFQRNVKIVSPERKNFLSYAYVLTKFCKLTNREDLLPYFSQLKSREKLLMQDRIWKAICADLDWPFHPSL